MTGISNPFNILDSVDSTNNYAMGMVKSGAWGDKQAVFAREQTAGKGQRGKHWISEKDANILISFVVDARFLPLGEQFGLSVAAALSCVQLIQSRGIDNIKIKWPNDIYIGDRKAGGILIETIIQGEQIKWAVVGIGINVNQERFGEGAKNPVSLKEVSSQGLDTLELASELYDIFYSLIEKLRSEGMAKFLHQYNLHLYKRSEKVSLKCSDEIFEIIIKEVTADGRLHTNERSFEFGEVEWLII